MKFSVTLNALSNLLCDAECVPNEKKLPKSADTIIWLVLAGLVMLLALFGTGFDYYVYNPQLKEAEVT